MNKRLMQRYLSSCTAENKHPEADVKDLCQRIDQMLEKEYQRGYEDGLQEGRQSND